MINMKKAPVWHWWSQNELTLTCSHGTQQRHFRLIVLLTRLFKLAKYPRLVRFHGNRTSLILILIRTMSKFDLKIKLPSVMTGGFVLSLALWRLFVSRGRTKTVCGWDQKHVRNNKEGHVTQINVWQASCFTADQQQTWSLINNQSY